jgi:hypothetical protein
MYSIDENDRVTRIKDFPQSSVGSPIPVIFSGEHAAIVAFYLQNAPENWDGTSVRVISADTADEPITLIKFASCYASMFGPPNDEAFHGHPLYERGLRPYGAFTIENSSWIRQLERMNSVHPYHRAGRFWALNHYVLSFHDSTFECIASGFSIEVRRGNIKDMLPRMIELLG